MGIFPMSKLNPNILCLYEAVNSNVKDIVISHRDHVDKIFLSNDDHCDLDLWSLTHGSIANTIEWGSFLPIGSALTHVLRSASNA